MTEDGRGEIYKDLHSGQLAQQEAKNRQSAVRILGTLFDYVQPGTTLDVGCGLGTWLRAASELGASEIQGLEGGWLDTRLLQIDPARVKILDLEQGFDLGRRYDLAICLEVAEHLSPAAADPLVTSLTSHADIVLFSAAIPFQGGHHHVNEQFPDYWSQRFARHGFRAIDCLRPRIWDDEGILWWFRQNILVFAHERAIQANERLRQELSVARRLRVVHPDGYCGRMQLAHNLANDYQRMLSTLGNGGVFQVTRNGDGSFRFSRLK
jgi:SAM-dependent methyltransferase